MSTQPVKEHSDDKSADGWIITVTPTIMDGTVVRWHKTLYQAEAVEPTISASRNMVSVRFADLRTDADVEKFESALRSACILRRQLENGARYDDVKQLATHKSDGLSTALRPVVAEPVGGEA